MRANPSSINHRYVGPASACVMLIALAAMVPNVRGTEPRAQRAADRSGQAAADALLPMRAGGKWGFIDREGKVVIEPHYDNASDFHEDRALIQLGDKWGYIDRRGVLVVPPKYVVAGDFADGLAAVTGPDDFLWPRPLGELRGPARVGYIDPSGEVVIKPEHYGEVAEAGFRDGRALVRLEALHSEGGSFGKGRRNGYLDKAGKFVIAPEYDHASAFADGLAKVWKDQKAMFIDTAGKVVIDVTEYRYTGDFSEGFASVAKRVNEAGTEVTKLGFIDREGKVVVAPEYDRVGDFAEGLAAVAIGWNHSTFVPKGMPYVRAKWGYIDRQGCLVIPLQFWWVGPFSQGLASVQLEEGGKSGFVDREGKIVIPIEFDVVGRFRDGLASVRVGDRWETYEAPGITGGRRRVAGKMGYIDKSGTLVWGLAE